MLIDRTLYVAVEVAEYIHHLRIQRAIYGNVGATSTVAVTL